MIGRTLLAAVLAILAEAAPAYPADERIRLLPYEPDQVVNVSVAPGFAAVIELAPDEAIQNIVVGNSAVWQVTANSSAERIIVKPLGEAVSTNMIVVTDVRRYIFLLDPNGEGSQGLFVLRFTYADADVQKAASHSVATYKLSGARSLFPSSMRDDGRRTTITWGDQTALPAVFAVGEGGEEGIVNGRMIEGNYVIEGTFAKVVFRLGDARAVASRKMLKGAP